MEIQQEICKGTSFVEYPTQQRQEVHVQDWLLGIFQSGGCGCFQQRAIHRHRFIIQKLLGFLPNVKPGAFVRQPTFGNLFADGFQSALGAKGNSKPQGSDPSLLWMWLSEAMAHIWTTFFYSNNKWRNVSTATITNVSTITKKFGCCQTFVNGWLPLAGVCLKQEIGFGYFCMIMSYLEEATFAAERNKLLSNQHRGWSLQWLAMACRIWMAAFRSSTKSN